jgi:hypothetical protein
MKKCARGPCAEKERTSYLTIQEMPVDVLHFRPQYCDLLSASVAVAVFNTVLCNMDTHWLRSLVCKLAHLSVCYASISDILAFSDEPAYC